MMVLFVIFFFRWKVESSIYISYWCYLYIQVQVKFQPTLLLVGALQSVALQNLFRQVVAFLIYFLNEYIKREEKKKMNTRSYTMMIYNFIFNSALLMISYMFLFYNFICCFVSGIKIFKKKNLFIFCLYYVEER